MGRGGKRGGGYRGKGGRGGRGGGRDNREDNRVSFDKMPKNNEKFERYYNSVLGLPEEEREDFWAALKRELPNSFRFAGSKGHALAVQKQLKERYIPEISAITHYDGTNVEPPKPIPWYPDELAWDMTTPKNVVRRFPPFQSFQKYLVSETSVGNISRQEIVSMIPPLVMDLQPGMVVLDMCAAPGSKAAQLLEMVHRGEEARVRKSLQDHAAEDGRETSPGVILKSGDSAEELAVDASDYGRATGLLIANDSDYKRSHMLIHQLKRLSSPNLIVTNHDATLYPSIKLPGGASGNRYLKFDRILADVPCSGDGTCRKNVNVWQDWNPGNALGLHITQVRILVRALQMLKVGGRVVYSTCSMNPVENEAVILSAIERCGGLEKVQLLKTDNKLPELKRSPGLKTWTVMDKGGRVFDSWDSVQQKIRDDGADHHTDRLAEGMFPPPPESASSKIPFERCMRVYAHQQDTGGFFISILEKMSEFKAIPESEAKKSTPKPPVSAIVDEIELRPTSSPGGSATPKIEDTDMLDNLERSIEETTTAPVARQNQENLTPDAIAGTKRSAEDDAEIDGDAQTKKLKIKEDVDSGAELNVTARPGDQRPSETVVEGPRRNKGGQQFEEPFKYISGSHPEVEVIESFYKLSPRFPRDRFMVRNAEGSPTKTIYYTSALIRDILTENEGKGIKFIHGGVKMFMKQDVQKEGVCKWRIQSEGMPILEGYVGEERVVRLYKRETLRKLLIEMFPKVTDNGWQNLGEIGERVNTIPMGCCVLRIEPSDAPDGFDERMVIPLWRSLHSLNLMLAKEDRTALLLRIYNDTTPLVNNHHPGKNAKEDSEKAVKEPEVESGFKVENSEIKVDVTTPALEATAPVNDTAMNPEIESIVADKDADGKQGMDEKVEQIQNGEETGGAEQQLNGTGV